METIYELSALERDVVSSIQSRYASAKQMLDHARQQIETKSAEITGLRAAVNHIALLIAHQQGLIKTQHETVSLDASLTKIVVKTPEPASDDK